MSPPLQLGGSFLGTLFLTQFLSLEILVKHAHAVGIVKLPGLLGANTLLCPGVCVGGCGVRARKIEGEERDRAGRDRG